MRGQLSFTGASCLLPSGACGLVGRGRPPPPRLKEMRPEVNRRRSRNGWGGRGREGAGLGWGGSIQVPQSSSLGVLPGVPHGVLQLPGSSSHPTSLGPLPPALRQQSAAPPWSSPHCPPHCPPVSFDEMSPHDAGPGCASPRGKASTDPGPQGRGRLRRPAMAGLWPKASCTLPGGCPEPPTEKSQEWDGRPLPSAGQDGLGLGPGGAGS